jgi:hypothetical protein
LAEIRGCFRCKLFAAIAVGLLVVLSGVIVYADMALQSSTDLVK